MTAVKQEDLERQLALVQANVADPVAGLFGPSSVTWRIDREAILFVGAGRALLLQLAHPWIAAAIADHSRSMMDPIDRFHRTFSIMFSIVFGTVGQALGAARRLHQRHAQITGTLTEAAGPFAKDSSYFANELSALRWVSATLTESSLLAHDLVLPPLSDGERERYYAESQISAALFGVPRAALPPDWKAFMVYNEEMWRSDTLAVTPAARAIADQMLWHPGGWPRTPKWYGILTARLLPPPLREAYMLRYGIAEQDAAKRTLKWLRRAYPLLPDRLRYVGPYHEARGRLLGEGAARLCYASPQPFLDRPAFADLGDPDQRFTPAHVAR